MKDSRRAYDRNWYLDGLVDDVALLLEGEEAASAPVQQQKKAVRAIYARFASNSGDNDKRVLTPAEVDRLLAFTADAAAHLSAEALDSRIPGVPEHFRTHLRIVRGDIPTVTPAAEIRSLMYVDGSLRIEGYFNDPVLADGGSASPFLQIGDLRRIDLPDTPLKKEFRYFDRPLIGYRTFEVGLTPAEIPPGSKLRFFVPGGAEANASARIRFIPPQARLSPGLGCTYTEMERGAGCDPAVCPQVIALEYVRSSTKSALGTAPAQDLIRIVEPGRGRRLTSELRAFRGLWTAGKAAGAPPTTKQKITESVLRLAFHLTRPFFSRRPPVLYFDKLYMGGDNGQYLFEHAARLDKRLGVRSCYLVRRNTSTYRELTAKGLRLIDYGSPWRKLYALHAHLICATHANALAFCGLNKTERRWFAHILRSHVVCIQHGLTVQYIPQYQARIVDNTERYYLAAGPERDNLMRPEYGYTSEQLRMTGLARYDGLVPDTKRIILFSASWRRAATRQTTHLGRTRSALTSFRDTAYFRVCTDLLADGGFAANLRRRGYALRFLVHPTATAHRGDFEEAVRLAAPDAPVEVVAAPDEGYERHLREAALLVTDYSGIQFDCAYMYKPIVYYLPPELPPNYPTDGFDPVRDGFGPVCHEQEELTAAILKILDGGLRAEERYAERVQGFFAFRDRNNCRRIYDDIAAGYELGRPR